MINLKARSNEHFVAKCNIRSSGQRTTPSSMFDEFIFVFRLNYNRHSDVGQVFSMIIILVECEMPPLT